MDELTEFEVASRKLRDACSTAAVSANLGFRRAAESRYGAAYQRLVRANLARQLKGKYRGG